MEYLVSLFNLVPFRMISKLDCKDESSDISNDVILGVPISIIPAFTDGLFALNQLLLTTRDLLQEDHQFYNVIYLIIKM